MDAQTTCAGLVLPVLFRVPFCTLHMRKTETVLHVKGTI